MSENIYCVYMHTNKVNGKKYIGQTKQEPEKRFGNNGLRYKGCSYFYSAIQKYGWDNFEHEIIASNLTSEEANKYEVKYIAYYETTNPQKGYNLNLGGSKNRGATEIVREKMRINHKDYKGKNHPKYGTKLSEETKEKISKSLTGKYKGKNHPCYGKPISEEQKEILREYAKQHYKGKNNPRAKAVLQFDLNKNFIREWDYIKLAALELKINKAAISFCCKGKQKTAGGFIWKYRE